MSSSIPRPRSDPALTVRTAVAADLPALRRVYRAASLSNAGDAPMLLARPEFLVFAGEGVAAGRTRVAVAGPRGDRRVVGFVTLAMGEDGPELEDLFVDPGWRPDPRLTSCSWSPRDRGRVSRTNRGHRIGCA